MPKLIDAEAAKAAIWKARTDATERWEALSHLDEARRQCWAVVQTCDRLLAALDALPDAREGFFDYVAKEAYRTGRSPQQVFAAEWETHVKLKDDALWPDASEQAIHAERIPVPPHLAEVQRVVIRQAQQAGDGAEEK